MKLLLILIPLFSFALDIKPITFDLRSLSVLVASKTHKNIIVTDDVKNLSVNYFINENINNTVFFNSYVSALKLKGLHVNEYDGYYIVSKTKKLKKEVIYIPQMYVITVQIFEYNKNFYKEKGFKTNIATKGIQIKDFDLFISTLTNVNAVLSTTKALSLSTQLKLLSTTKVVNILQEPYMTCIDGKENSINVGGTIQVLTSKASNDNSKDSVIRNTYEEKPIGLTLTAKPQKLGDKILFDLKLTIENVIQSKDGLVTTSRKQTVNSFIIEDGGSILIGGLIDKQETTDVSGIPLLKDVPLLGYFFSYTEDKIDEKVLSILVSVKVVK